MTFKQEVNRAYQRYQKECGLHLKWEDACLGLKRALIAYPHIRVALQEDHREYRCQSLHNPYRAA